jgi:hypothetical protein
MEVASKPAPSPEKRLNLVFLLIGVVYSVITLVISSIVIAGIQQRGGRLGAEITGLESRIERNTRLFKEAAQEIRDGQFMAQTALMMAPSTLTRDATSDSLELAGKLILNTRVSAAGYFSRGISGIHELVRDRPEVAERQADIEARIASLRDGEFDAVGVPQLAAELSSSFSAMIDEWIARQDQLKLEKQEVGDQESLVKNIALALQFFNVFLIFGRDYYKEKLKGSATHASA